MERKFTRMIQVSFEWVGFHCWPGAPAGYDYLASKHRHKFHAKVLLEVWHDDREVEFHEVLDMIQEDIMPGLESETRSCESIAEWILNSLLDYYGEHRYGCVAVLEDNENGGVAEWDPNQTFSKKPSASQAETVTRTTAIPSQTPAAGPQSPQPVPALS